MRSAFPTKKAEPRAPESGGEDGPLSAHDLLSGSALVHEVDVPGQVLHPTLGDPNAGGKIRLRPLTVGTLALISRASRDDSALVPLLMIKEALVEPALTLDQIQKLHIGLVDFVVSRINQVSGLTLDGESVAEAGTSGLGSAHILLAKHFGWTPEQVSQLTPGQVAVYLAGIERLLALDGGKRESA